MRNALAQPPSHHARTTPNDRFDKLLALKALKQEFAEKQIVGVIPPDVT